MKKIALLLALVLMGSSAFAAVGVGTWGGWPVLKGDFGPVTGSLGAAYNSPNAGTATTALLAKIDYKLVKLGNVQTAVGAYYTTNGAAAPADTVTMGLTWGASAMVESNLEIGADFILANSTTVNSAAFNTGILPAVAVTACLYLM